MSVPSVPTAPIVNSQMVSTPWRIFFVQLVNFLQGNLDELRYQMPNQDTTSINNLNGDSSTDAQKRLVQSNQGGLVFNTDNKTTLVNNRGTYNPINTYEEMTTTEINAIPSGERNGRFILDTTAGTLKVGFNNQFATVTTS